MPNNKYLRSVKKERELVNKYRADGWTSARTAGSKSPIDVFAMRPPQEPGGVGEIRFIQIKTKKGARGWKQLNKVVFKANVESYWISYE